MSKLLGLRSCRGSDQVKRTKEWHTYAVKDPVAVAELKPTESHCHPALDVGREENEGAVFDYHLQVRVEEL
jgi:hypothetical protein